MPVVSLRPSSDVSVTDWETGTGSGSNLYAEIDETSVSSSDYIETEGGTAKFELTNPSAGIVAATMRVRFRKDGDDEANLTVRLLQNNYPTTWNPAGKTSNIALSGGDLIATVGNSGYAGARTVASYSAGKKYAEIEYIGPGPVTLTVGFSNSSYGFADALGNTNNDLGWWYDGRIFLNSTLVDTISAYAPGATLCLAVDFDNEKFWARPLSDPNWNDDVVSNQNPATNTGGVSFSSLAAGPYYLTFFVYFASGGSFTLNAGQAAYAGVKPAGFTNWSGGGEATVAEWEFTDIADTDVDEEVALTAPEFALITDASDLRIEFEASVSSVPANGLLTGLVSYWPMQEASGTREDIHGSWDFPIYTSAIGRTTGHVDSFAADFSGGSPNVCFYGAESGFDFSAAAFTIACWFRPTSLASLFGLFGKAAEFRQLITTDGTAYMQSPGAFSDIVNTASGVIVVNEWFLIIASYDPAGDLSIQIGSDSTNTLGSVITDAVGTTISDSSNIFFVGQYDSSTTPLIGQMEQFALWSRVLTSDERTALFNGGAGLTYSSFTA